jgi:transcriptional regulator with XRE-family HTH domain
MRSHGQELSGGPRQRELGARLRQVRGAAGITQIDIGKQLLWSQPKVSRAESGRYVPTEAEIQTWAGLCALDAAATHELQASREAASTEHHDLDSRVRADFADVQAQYARFARDATVIRNAEPILVPGLLQTPEYARSPLSLGLLNDASRRSITQAVTARIERQGVLMDTRRKFEFVILESVLYYRQCTAKSLIKQLEHLRAVSQLTNVSLGVLPAERHTTPLPEGFVMFDDVAVAETLVEEIVYRGERAAKYGALMDRLVAEADFGDAARQRMDRAIAELRP